MGLPIQLPPTMEERTTMCVCKDRPTPSPSPSPSLSPSPSPSSSQSPSPSPSSSPSPQPIIMVSFKGSSYSALEGDGSITFTIQLSQAFEEPISVEFCTEDSDPLSAEGTYSMWTVMKIAQLIAIVHNILLLRSLPI